ncbi:hypothetical protein Pr1d_34710 [Bythopirellula goksoeyrii]|uniref:Uncharacterized protein n=1 Tax=Bythopirellula goksoeyrii TaxID=1400387 RepID=A0A5B9QF60_9BACT|nr:hypothetical protein Pr1d_34710 [Bythopirellula goksoeyrii]
MEHGKIMGMAILMGSTSLAYIVFIPYTLQESQAMKLGRIFCRGLWKTKKNMKGGKIVKPGW